MATDLSARSDRALERAVSLARDHGAHLTVVHVVDEDLPPALAEAQLKAARHAIQEHIGALAADDGPDISIEVLYGRAHADILEMCGKITADLIVLGVHREDASADMFRGTTAERLLRAGNVPVLMVRDRASGPYRRSIVGVDFSVYSRRAIEFAIKFVTNGECFLVHAYDVPFKGFLYGRDTQSEIREQHEKQFDLLLDGETAAALAGLAEKAPKIECVMQEGSSREVIYQQFRRLEPDLLVIGTHGRTGVAHAVLGSVAEDLLRAPPCDVLAVKAW